MSALTVLIVEDSLTQALRLRLTLERHDFTVCSAVNGEEALRMLSQAAIQLVISDVVMPVMDGFALCRRMKADERYRHIPVILLTSLSEPSHLLQGLESGADNFITKPYDETYIISRLHEIIANTSHQQATGEQDVRAIFEGREFHITAERQQIVDFMLSAYEIANMQNSELLLAQDKLRTLNQNQEQIIAERTAALEAEIEERKAIEEKLIESRDHLSNAMHSTVKVLSNAVEKRDPYIAGHQQRVADIAVAIGKKLGLSEIQLEGLYIGGLLHDIGKIQVPAEILSKPGRLTEVEFALIKTHSQAGYDILEGIEFPWPIAQMVLQHQERLDGSGYPNGLSGEQIILEARIIAVSDVTEAISSHRPYRPALGTAVAMEEIRKKRGIWFDAEVADACLSLFEEGMLKL